jgi:hypothetical protein
VDDAIALDGFLDEERMLGPHATARFRIFVSPTDERTDEMVLPCTVTDPDMAAAVLYDLVPGAMLRVTGHFRLPHTPDEPMWLEVTDLAPLQDAPDRPADTVADLEALLDSYEQAYGVGGESPGKVVPIRPENVLRYPAFSRLRHVS